MFILITNGVVVQKQPNAQSGFIEAPDTVVCGMLDNGDGTFSNPPPVPVSPLQLIQQLENEMTPRRLREHLDGTEQAGWWDAQTALINAERAKL
ncbi:hypothetical protein N9937_02130 [bacterium]|nr:hypothetical protein [bacterium]